MPCSRACGIIGVVARVLIPLPDTDFDVTEVAVPWQVLTSGGHEIVFATESGGVAPAADQRLLDGVLFGQLGAEPEPKRYYADMIASAAYRQPVSWQTIDVSGFDGLLLPGGHAPGMRQYLGSPELQQQVVRFWHTGKPVGAICHGVLVLARSIDPATGKSVLADQRTTCLPKYMEFNAYALTAWRLGRYYRTYHDYVEDEVRAALDNDRAQFERGPRVLTKRGTATDDGPAFVVTNKRYASARWPGDAYLFARTFRSLLEAAAKPPSPVA